MNAITFDDTQAFLERARPFLAEREAEYNLLLGVIDGLVRYGIVMTPYLGIAEESSGRIDCVGLMTPPWQLLVTRGSDRGLSAIAETLFANGWSLPGVQGPEREAEIFARLWSERTGLSFVEKFRLRIYELQTVIMPQGVSGKLRQGTNDDLERTLQWIAGFHTDANSGVPEEEWDTLGKACLRDGRLFFWEDEGEAVSMAVWNPSPPHGARISYVYTPREFRRQGYGGAVTAALSRHLLDTGVNSCFLFTDLANPMSNNIYRKIGYVPVSDNRHYRFVDAESTANSR